MHAVGSDASVTWHAIGSTESDVDSMDVAGSDTGAVTTMRVANVLRECAVYEAVHLRVA